jgi:hypothetical protein
MLQQYEGFKKVVFPNIGMLAYLFLDTKLKISFPRETDLNLIHEGLMDVLFDTFVALPLYDPHLNRTAWMINKEPVQ